MSIDTKKINNSGELGNKAEALKNSTEGKRVISICSGTGCKAAGADDGRQLSPL